MGSKKSWVVLCNKLDKITLNQFKKESKKKEINLYFI